MRILVFENDSICQFILRKMLNAQNFELHFCKNPKDGLEMFERHYYDLVMVDLNLPILNGHEVACKINNHRFEFKSRIPVIAMVPSVDYANRAFSDLGCFTDMIVKPFSRIDLLKIANKHYYSSTNIVRQ